MSAARPGAWQSTGAVEFLKKHITIDGARTIVARYLATPQRPHIESRQCGNHCHIM
jgi:hypothetical protein